MGTPRIPPGYADIGGEEILSSYTIIDDDFLHHLVILRDTNTASLRLEARASGGEMKGMPVWTGFITYKVSSPRWLLRTKSRTVLLNDFPLHIFSSDYSPQRGPCDQQELRFNKVEDADLFVEAIHTISNRSYR